MVRLNNQGVAVPLKPEDLKKLPFMPHTATRLKFKYHTDMGLHKNKIESDEIVDLKEEDSDAENDRDHQIVHRAQTTNSIDDEATTVFDLVHRGRQRQQHYKALQKQATINSGVLSPKVMSPANIEVQQ